MSKIYQISEKIHKSTGWKLGNIFLFLNVIFWAFLALIVSIAGFYLMEGTLEGKGIVLFCIVGYTGMIIGFFGGALYLYRQE